MAVVIFLLLSICCHTQNTIGFYRAGRVCCWCCVVLLGAWGSVLAGWLVGVLTGVANRKLARDASVSEDGEWV